MRKKLGLFVGTVLVALAATFAFSAKTTTVGAQGESCRAHCKNLYNACLRDARNPGDRNQCRKAYADCLETCQ